MIDQQPVPVVTDEESVNKMPLRRPVESEGSETTSDQRLYATLAHILGIVSGPIGALVIMLLKKEDAWVEKEAREAINFQITVLLVWLCGAILMLILVGILVIIAVAVLNVVFCVIAAAHVNEGNPYRYPISLRLIKASV